MNNVVLEEENNLDLLIYNNKDEYSNIKNELCSSVAVIQKSLNSCSNKLNSMRDDVLCNLEKGLECYSQRVENLPSKIRDINDLKCKLHSAIQLVENILSLKKCNNDFKLGMSNKDYLSSALCINKYLNLRNSCINLESDLCNEMESERERLYKIICDNLDRSLSNGNIDDITYFIKLFVPIGKANEGLEIYIKFIRDNISEKCMSIYNESITKSNKTGGKMNFSEIITSLFVTVFECINNYQENLIDFFSDIESENSDTQNVFLNKYTVIRQMYTKLMEEVDVQCSIIFNKFEREYSVYLDNKWNEIDENGMLNMGISNFELDRFLEEISYICKLYFKFKVRINDLINSYINENNNHLSSFSDKKTENLYNNIDRNENTLSSKIQLLSFKYVSCEYAYLLYSINQALNHTDEISWNDQDILNSTLVEDIFFLLHKTSNRCISIGNAQSLKLIISHINQILSNVVKKKIVENIQYSKPLYETSLGNSNESISCYSNKHLLDLIQKKEVNASNINSKYSWTHSLNNLQACIENLEIISKTIVNDFEEYYTDLKYFEMCVDNYQEDDKDNQSITKNSDKYEVTEYIEKAFEQTISEYKSIHEYYSKISLQILSKISISPILVHLHDEITFEMSELESKEYSLNNSFIPSLSLSLKTINDHLRCYYNNQSSEFILSLMIERIVNKIEQIIVNYPEKKKFSIYGALAFENDIRNLLSFTNSLLSISIRHMFLRILEICDLLNIISLEELRELLITDFPCRNWHLSKSEIVKVLFLRSDIDHVKLQAIINKSNNFFN
ncbi:hypothetical protein FG386_000018 [Cryptosporidium ryanae]|uniref:uncharacterized protein n=1 Tax=Cryptosporidium ryanae TaxID=515981 RepID=UPI00351A96E4|nr:hypothetical protein FG386_000018 [Cryptosporidium ryanae]